MGCIHQIWNLPKIKWDILLKTYRWQNLKTIVVYVVKMCISIGESSFRAFFDKGTKMAAFTSVCFESLMTITKFSPMRRFEMPPTRSSLKRPHNILSNFFFGNFHAKREHFVEQRVDRKHWFFNDFIFSSNFRTNDFKSSSGIELPTKGCIFRNKWDCFPSRNCSSNNSLRTCLFWD